MNRESKYWHVLSCVANDLPDHWHLESKCLAKCTQDAGSASGLPQPQVSTHRLSRIRMNRLYSDAEIEIRMMMMMVFTSNEGLVS